MAFSVSVTAIRAADGEQLWSVEPRWWRESELRDETRFEDVSEDPGYTDYEADLTVEEAKALAEKFAPNATLDHWQEPLKDLDRKLAGCDSRSVRIRIRIFEWESGYG